MTNRLAIGLIGNGAIAHYVARQVMEDNNINIIAVICRPNSLSRAQQFADGRFDVVTSIDKFVETPDLMVDCAGHQGLAMHGPSILAAGIDVVSISTGAMADAELETSLRQSARLGGARLKFLSGAIGGIDALSAGNIGGLGEVTYRGRKPPVGWRGSPAEDKCSLDNLKEAFTHFTGSAREAALLYPKNANVAASIALAGLGLDETQVELIADPGVTRNTHEVVAHGEFGAIHLKIEGNTLPGNPKTSALAAMSIVSELKRRTRNVYL